MLPEKDPARRGNVEDGMRMSPACCTRAPQRWTSRTYMPFLLMLPEVRPIRKTRNQLMRTSSQRLIQPNLTPKVIEGSQDAGGLSPALLTPVTCHSPASVTLCGMALLLRPAPPDDTRQHGGTTSS